MRERIIVALDLPDADEAAVLAAGLQGRVPRVKVGLTLFSTEGPAIVERLRALGFGIFLDLKLHDIPHQVGGACRELVRLGVDMITVHASGGRAMVRAAAEALDEAARDEGVDRPALLAVTVLTSLGADALAECGVAGSPEDQVAALASLAMGEGADGIVCSPLEAARVRSVVGDDALVVTPGVRPSWAATDDQARTATPAEALRAGASHLVIGRPITGAPDAAAAVERIVEEG